MGCHAAVGQTQKEWGAFPKEINSYASLEGNIGWFSILAQKDKMTAEGQQNIFWKLSWFVFLLEVSGVVLILLGFPMPFRTKVIAI